MTAALPKVVDFTPVNCPQYLTPDGDNFVFSDHKGNEITPTLRPQFPQSLNGGNVSAGSRSARFSRYTRSMNNKPSRGPLP
jgi:hypothetical protein